MAPTGLPARRFVFRLFIIYLLDWLVILGTVAFAASTSIWVTPNTRPFSDSDLSISFPFQTKAKVPNWLLVLCSVIIPGLIIIILALLLPSHTHSYAKSFRSGSDWKRRLYCLNTALLGLGLSYATALLITNGLKNLLGRPRPDLLSRCNLDRETLDQFRIGPGSLLSWNACRNREFGSGTVPGALDEADVRDGFRSFPSGHASLSFAGLTYLSIFLAEFVFALPLPHLSKATVPISGPIIGEQQPGPSESSSASSPPATRVDRETPLPRFPIMAAILLCGVPLLGAMYISSTRFSDYRHHTFDILAGLALGILSAWLGWRWYGAWTCAAQADGRVYRYIGGSSRAHRKRNDEKDTNRAMVEYDDSSVPGRAV